MAAVSSHGINGEEWGERRGFWPFPVQGKRTGVVGRSGRSGTGRRPAARAWWLWPVGRVARWPARACVGETAPAGGPERQGERGGEEPTGGGGWESRGGKERGTGGLMGP
jgi:hypothetical protein